MLYYSIIFDITQDTVVHCIGWLADGQLKRHTKKHSESENNVVGDMIFQAQLTCQLGPY